MERNKKKFIPEYEQFKKDATLDGYLPNISFEDWYQAWIHSGHWDERKDGDSYAYYACPKEGELKITKESIRIVERGHYDIMNMVNDRVPYEDIDKFIAEKYEE